MGYLRLRRDRTSVVVDAAMPPPGPASHASTLAFEVTSGRRPMIVNCGPGDPFGGAWPAACRRRAAHSTLVIEATGQGLGPGRRLATGEEAPLDVQADTDLDGATPRIVAAHSAYAARCGLIHVRRLDLSSDGRRLSGEDMLTAVTERERRRFDRALLQHRGQNRRRGEGLPFTLRFHLHPDVTATIETGGRAAALRLASGEVWLFRQQGARELRLDPSIYLEKTGAGPRACLQLVLSGQAVDQATSVGWSLTKAPDSPDHIRDLRRADELETIDPREEFRCRTAPSSDTP